MQTQSTVINRMTALKGTRVNSTTATCWRLAQLVHFGSEAGLYRLEVRRWRGFCALIGCLTAPSSILTPLLLKHVVTSITRGPAAQDMPIYPKGD